MTADMWITIVILITAIVLFVTELLRVDLVALLVLVVLMLTGILAPSEALSGFSNTAVISIAALFVVGGAVMHTGLANIIGRKILKIAGQGETRLMVIIMLAVAFLSCFMSNTGTVAVLLPAIISLANSAKVNPSKLLMPLSFGSLLGGALTLIGTPPNLIVSDVLKKEGLEPFQFFDFAPVGLVLLVVGILFMIFIGKKLLPDHKTQKEFQVVETPEEMTDRYRLPENLFRLRVRTHSDLVGKTILNSGLRREFGIVVIEILRKSSPKKVVKLGKQQLVLQSNQMQTIIPTGEDEMQVDDILIVHTDKSSIQHAAAFWNLAIQPPQASDQKELVNNEVGIAEVLLPASSTLINKTLSDLRFGTSFKLTVLNISRPNATEKLDLRETQLQFGDILLVQGTWKDILKLRQNRKDFIVMGQPEAMLGPQNPKKAPITLLILLLMVVAMVTKLVPVTAACMTAGVAVVLSGCLTMDEAYDSVDWESIILIAGMLPLSIALQKTGLIGIAAQTIIDVLGPYSPYLVLAGLFAVTTTLTQVLSNTATTVLIAPIAFVSAAKLGMNPHGFLMTVAVAASMAFASPVASPTNTLVMGAGKYTFKDYMKIGIPMVIVMLVTSTLVIPMIWPFH